jgi:hypothetical protein
LAALVAICSIYAVFTLLALSDVPISDWHSAWREQMPLRIMLLGGGCFLAGVFRIARFHPRRNPTYGNWLAGTPWRPGVRLPLGPVTMVWEDLLLVAPLSVLAVADAHLPWWTPLVGFVLGYALVALGCLPAPRNRWPTIGVFALASLPVYWHQSQILLCVTMVVISVLAHLVVARSLIGFPWDLGDSMRALKRQPLAGVPWPLNRIGPAEPRKPIPAEVGFAGALLVGWWAYVLLSDLAELDMLREFVLPLIVIKQIPVLGAAAALARLLIYCAFYWPPISWRGRLFTGRWIIPTYDYVLIAPLLMFGASYYLPRLLAESLPLPLVGAITLALIAAIGFNAGPTLRHWQLTGHHRLVPGSRREPPLPKTRALRG